MESEEIVKMIIFVVILVVMVAGAAILLSGKGAEVIGSIKDLLRFGR
jgi:hypothetical protein